jgi:hypothetical protein
MPVLPGQGLAMRQRGFDRLAAEYRVDDDHGGAEDDGLVQLQRAAIKLNCRT